jgi:hypothetical protein
MSTGFCGWMKAGRIACNKSAIVSATMAVRTPFRGTLKKCIGVPFESASLGSGTSYPNPKPNHKNPDGFNRSRGRRRYGFNR